MFKASQLVTPAAGDYLETLNRCGGYYECPKDVDGKRLGPLVGYTGKYLTKPDRENWEHWVGDTYYNFAVVERYPHVVANFAFALASKVRDQLGEVDLVLGTPMGGIIIGFALAQALDCQFAYAEKKVITSAAEHERERSALVMNRHEIPSGLRVLIAEDVCNNFSTTNRLLKLARKHGNDEVVGVACVLNRAKTVKFESGSVVSLLRIPTKQYRQDDPEVAQDIQAENVIWKPKGDWPRLREAMETARSSSAKAFFEKELI